MALPIPFSLIFIFLLKGTEGIYAGIPYTMRTKFICKDYFTLLEKYTLQI